MIKENSFRKPQGYFFEKSTGQCLKKFTEEFRMNVSDALPEKRRFLKQFPQEFF